MRKILNYQIVDELSVSFESAVYRAVDINDQKRVIIKLLNIKDPSVAALSKFNHEYTITLLASSSEASIKVYSLEKYEETLLMILEDFPGIPINRYVPELLTPEDQLARKIQIAIQISEALDKIHQLNIVHKNISADNILYSAENKVVKIIDYGLSTTLIRERVEAKPVNAIEGTLSYISPEQTGRMNRGVDYRSDYYSLGAVLYELFTGHLPFTFKDPLDLIYAHIAIIPEPPENINKLPKPLSDIILKLLAKNSEDRYQSLLGLKADLEKCYVEFKENNQIIPFPIGNQDVSYSMVIPEKLYGRDKERDFLLQAFNDSNEKNKEKVIFISGYAGIGKTSLINELIKEVTKQEGYLIKGRFDQMKSNKPFSALIEALGNLLKQILMESKESIERWRDIFIAAIGTNGRILTDILPQLEIIIGKQAELASMNPTERQLRFSNTLQNFIQALLSPGKPIVLFIDDLQWAALQSLQLLEDLALNNRKSRLFIIASYRDNEITPTHPLMGTLEKFRNTELDFEELTLEALSISSVNALIADTFHTDTIETTDLAEICFKKTNGNPFFLKQLMGALLDAHYIYLNAATRKWEYDLNKVATIQHTENVIDLLAVKIRSLPRDAQNILKFAACIGKVFDDDVLSIVCQYPISEIKSLLQIAAAENLIISTGEFYKKDKELVTIAQYEFMHDRVQQAAHLLLDERQKKSAHLTIANYLLAQNQQEKEANIFKISDHLNQGFGIDLDVPTKLEYAALNLQAGRIAKKSTAYSAALSYLTFGLAWLPKNTWNTNYELTYQLYLEASEVNFLLTYYQEMRDLNTIILEHAQDEVDKAYVYDIEIHAYVAQNKLAESLELSFTVLEKLGLKLPKKAGKFQVLLALLRTEWLLYGKTEDELYHLPIVSDRRILAIIKIVSSIVSSCYLAYPNHFALMVLSGIEYSLKYGNSVFTPFDYACYAAIQGGTLERISVAIKYGLYAARLVNRFPVGSIKIMPLNFVLLSTVEFWINPIAEMIDKYNNAIQLGIDQGDIEYTSWTMTSFDFILFSLGFENLAKFKNRTKKYLKYFEDNKLWPAHHIVSAVFTGAEILGRAEVPSGMLVGRHYDEIKDLPQNIANKEHAMLYFVYFSKLMIAYFSRDFDTALNYAIKIKKMLTISWGRYFYFYYGLILLEIIHKVPFYKKLQILPTLFWIKRKLKKFTKYSSIIYTSKFYLICAEMKQYFGLNYAAIRCYELAIREAHNNELHLDSGIAYELTARYYYKIGMNFTANSYIKKSYHYYGKWGAKAKQVMLVNEFSEILALEQEERVIARGEKDAFETTTSRTSIEVLDLKTILKISKIFAKEIDLKKLLQKVIKTLYKVAGAEKIALGFQREGELYIDALKETDSKIIKLKPILYESSDKSLLPHTVINYVINSQEMIAIDNAAEDTVYSRDPYVLEKKARSILCLPLQKQKKLIGFLYLENDKITHAFTSKHIEILKYLTSHIALALENAYLYSDIMQISSAYERFVPKNFIALLQKKRITDVELGTHTLKNMSVLFADLHNFTSLSEKLDPETISNILNSFIAHMEPVIKRNSGFIDKYIGDEIMALFPGTIEDALNTAIEMQVALQDFNQTLKIEGIADLEIGIGVNFGSMLLCTIGNKVRMENTVISDVVNIASRIQSLTKQYGTNALTTESVINNIRDKSKFASRIIDNIVVRGKTKATVIYEIIDALDIDRASAIKNILPQYDLGWQFFEAGNFSEAKKQFTVVLENLPDDMPSRLLLERCDAE